MGSRDVLEVLGFKEVYKGEKSRSTNRERAHGPLYMFIADPGELEDNITAFIKRYEKATAKSKAVLAERAKFQSLTIPRLKSQGILEGPITSTCSINFYARKMPSEIQSISMKDYGVDLSVFANMQIGQLVAQHHNWKQGLPNVFED
jgi:hypothetical protein